MEHVAQIMQWLGQIHPLGEEAKYALEGVCSTTAVKKGNNLQPIGFTCRTIYIVAKGLARIFYYKDGIDVTESFALEQQVIVRVESLFTGRPSRKGIQAVENTVFVAIDAAALFRLYDVYPAIERLFRKIFEAAHVDTVNRLESLQFHTAEERYQALLTENPEIIQRIPLKYIASYLGITQVSLSRIRARQ